MTNVNELKDLYIALGGEAADVSESTTNVDVLNALAAKYEGAGDAQTNAQAIANIVAVAENIGGGPDVLILHDENDELDQTWQTISNAMTAGKTVIIEQGDYLTVKVSKTTSEDDDFIVWTYLDGSGQEADAYYASSADGYPNGD